MQGLTDFDLVKHGALIPHLPLLGLPLSFFTLTGSSLGLLLVFRTNAAYAPPPPPRHALPTAPPSILTNDGRAAAWPPTPSSEALAGPRACTHTHTQTHARNQRSNAARGKPILAWSKATCTLEQQCAGSWR